ncbi:MATE family efflux transporter [Vibrio nigripulchritudo]|uniref:MATE family efflux transporter n=1 Tax=Vibrio nigripulchritudo TaxID=28173 RepID=UPI0024919C5B|nr:MATE family efflux transporter [Vibrio nigripulchritudo]BDU36731.1 MATE family efflux transporter [Vibrio nigripulchritudo]BDU42441.1 MATE family efflux transporter [Vibrio nigripulchritudo]
MTSTAHLAFQHTRGDFVRKLFAIALPITLQSMMFSSRGMVDVLMLGQLGEAEIAAVGIASRAMFVTTIMLVGITTGGAMLIAQYWGAANHQGVKESTALTWMISMLVAALTVFGFVFFPSEIMAIATDSPEVVDLGKDYIILTAFSMFGVACVASMAVGLRSIQKPGLSTFFSGIGILSNVFFNWVLIFGNLGAPALGIKGAAIATLISSCIEVTCLFGYLYWKKHLLSFGFKEMAKVWNMDTVTRFLKLSLPTTFNFLAWAGGLFAYHAILGQAGVQGLAALSVMTPVESMSLCLLIGVSNASAVLIGNQLGAKDYESVYYRAIGLVAINIVLGIITATVLFVAQMYILDAFTALTEETRALSEKFILILCVGIVLRSFPMMAIVGILRAGGDVNFCLYQDLIAQWVIGIPVAAFCAIILGWKPEFIFALFLLEELIKWFGSSYRIKSKKWIRNLVGN